jgi:signal transduction histidine kinase/ligand-binding sensor domain-containing protein
LSSARNWRQLLTAASIAAGIFTTSVAYAIDPQRGMSQYVRDSWGTEQGFPKGPVYAINQTRDGYLWIATQAGLVRFDGWNFSLIRDSSGAQTIANVIGLVPTGDGCLWIRLPYPTMLRYCGDAFEGPAQYGLSGADISAASRANDGSLLVWKLDDGAFVFRNHRFQMLSSAADLPRSPVIALAQTPNGDLWMGTRDAGLFRRSGNQTEAIRKGLPDPKINCLFASGDGDLWVGTDNGIVRWNGSELTSAGIPPSLNHFQALVIAKDRDANVWVGTDSRGLLRFNSSGSAALPERGSPEAVTAVFEDRESNLWIGRAAGIERIRDSPFVTYSGAEGLPTGGSNPVFVDAENRMWFPPVAGGLWWAKGEQHGRVTNDGLDQDVVYSIAGRNGELWLGRQHGGLTHLRSVGNLFTSKTYTKAQGLAEDSVFAVSLSRDGSVLAGTLSAGLSVLRNGKFTNYTIRDGLASNTIASILESSDGTIWIATPNGVTAKSKDHARTYTVKDGLPSDDVNCLFQDSAGTLWAGTAAGLAFRVNGGFRVPKGAPAPLLGQVFGIAEDRSNSLWLATADRVVRVERDKLRGSLTSEDIHQYGLADGLRSAAGVKRQQSVVADAQGRIWISLSLGISVVDPALLARGSAPPIVHVQGVSADGSPIPLGNGMHIPSGRRRIAFDYVGLSYSGPDRVHYRYRLDGFDHEWGEPVTSREAEYTNLPPGPYRFRVIASNPDGVWSTQEASIPFEVDPLLWQRGWFELSAGIMAAGVFFGLYRWRLRQVTKRLNFRFQERLAERNRIAQDLHDTLLQGFLSASMQVHVAADSLPEDSKVKPVLTRAQELMRQVIDEGRNAVRGLRSGPGASVDLAQAFSQIQHEIAAEQPAAGEIFFRVIVEGQPRPLHPVLRDEVYRIGREGLINAFRHANARKIEIVLRYSASLHVSVRDNGRGIAPETLRSGKDGHFGLLGMRERAEQIGARFHVFSGHEVGTEINLEVPGHLAFHDRGNSGIRRLRGLLFEKRRKTEKTKQ